MSKNREGRSRDTLLNLIENEKATLSVLPPHMDIVRWIESSARPLPSNQSEWMNHDAITNDGWPDAPAASLVALQTTLVARHPLPEGAVAEWIVLRVDGILSPTRNRELIEKQGVLAMLTDYEVGDVRAPDAWLTFRPVGVARVRCHIVEMPAATVRVGAAPSLPRPHADAGAAAEPRRHGACRLHRNGDLLPVVLRADDRHAAAEIVADGAGGEPAAVGVGDVEDDEAVVRRRRRRRRRRYFPSCDAHNPAAPSGPCRSTCRELRDSGCAGMAALDCESDTCCGGHCFSDDEATCTRY